MATETIAGTHRQLQVDRVAGAQGAERRARERLGDDVECKPPRIVDDDRQADAVNRDGVFGRDSFGDCSRDFDQKTGAAACVALLGDDAPDVRDEARKHAYSRAKGAERRRSSPSRSTRSNRNSGSAPATLARASAGTASRSEEHTSELQ